MAGKGNFNSCRSYMVNSPPAWLLSTEEGGLARLHSSENLSKIKIALFFVDNNKTIDILIQDFYYQITDTLSLPAYVKITTPEDLLDFLFTCREDLVVVFDEFQRFYDIYPAFITQLQNKWDMRGDFSRLFIIASGSSVG